MMASDSLASLASLLAAVARTPRVPPVLPLSRHTLVDNDLFTLGSTSFKFKWTM